MKFIIKSINDDVHKKYPNVKEERLTTIFTQSSNVEIQKTEPYDTIELNTLEDLINLLNTYKYLILDHKESYMTNTIPVITIYNGYAE